MKHIMMIVISALSCFSITEVTLFWYSTYKNLPIIRPSYDLNNLLIYDFHADINSHWGIWRKNNSRHRHKSECFDVSYSSNSYGANDKERQLTTNDLNRVIVLGDSFVEGFGVNYEDRMTSIMEYETGIEYLNFSTMGDFGTIQAWLMYKNLASRFTHNTVIMCILPYNDFTDNSYEMGKRLYRDRYRPYLIGNYPNYELIYYKSSIEESRGHPSRQSYLKGILREFTYTYNVVGYLLIASRYEDIQKVSTTTSFAEPKPSNSPPIQLVSSKYYEFSEQDFNLLKYTIEQVQKDAGNRDLIVCTIPLLQDIKRFGQSGEAPLTRRLKDLSDRINFQYIDLLPYMHDHTSDWRRYFHTCDGHWNEYGNRVVAEFLIKNLH